MTLFTERLCSTDQRQLPVENGVQSGYYCCDEYFCSATCLDISFDGAKNDDGTPMTWRSHFEDDGDCYYTEWDEESDE